MELLQEGQNDEVQHTRRLHLLPLGQFLLRQIDVVFELF